MIREELLNEYDDRNLKKELDNAKKRIQVALNKAEFSIEPEKTYTELGKLVDWIKRTLNKLEKQL